MTSPGEGPNSNGASDLDASVDLRASGESFDPDPILPVTLTSAPENRYEVPASLIEGPAHLAAYIVEERLKLNDVILNKVTHHNPGADASSTPGIDLAREYSDLIDAVIRRMFSLACTAAALDPRSAHLAIVATGGYGRRELAPYSDIDLTFIPQRDGDAQTDRIVRELFRLVMDVFIARCGLEVGYAYRLFSDCRSLDHQTTSGLMDARYIVGSQRLFIQFEDAFWEGFNAPEFIFTKIDERAAVLKKYGLLPRCVEPQLKEGPGGLRDIHTAVWLVQARSHLAATRVRGNRGLSLLSEDRGLGANEVHELIRAKETLFKVRNALHAVSGVHRDQLVVTRQEDIAAILGYVSVHSESVADNPPAVERFMADLYPSLAACRQLCHRVVREIGNSRLMLGIGLDCVNRQIVAANGSLTRADPAWLAWACELAQRYRLELSDEIQAAAASLIESSPRTDYPEQVAVAFTQMLCRTGSVYPIMQVMADLGILAWIVPEFGRLMDLIPYDAAHDYTVGQHTLLVIRNVDDLSAGTVNPPEAEERAEMRRALSELAHPEYLMLAALLHDTGKADPTRPHAELSANIADAVCRRLNWSAEASDTVRFLVLHHQLMGDTSRLRDLNLDKTIRDFVSIVDDIDRLNMLYLLTYADTRAVGEGIWTAVKGTFLRELWQRATAAIFYQESPTCLDDTVAIARRKMRRDLTLENFDEHEIEEHIGAMPPYYLLNSTLQNVAVHIGFIRRVRSGEIVIDFHDEYQANYTELTICIRDEPRPGLLTKIAAALLASSLNVHSATVVTRATAMDRIAIDSLLVDYKSKPLSPGKCKELSGLLEAVLGGHEPVEDILPRANVYGESWDDTTNRDGGVHEHLRRITIELISHDFDEGVSLIEISGRSSLDLFYRICTAVSSMGWDIQAAKLSEAREVMRASLYITGARQVSDNEIKRRVTRALEGISAKGGHLD